MAKYLNCRLLILLLFTAFNFGLAIKWLALQHSTLQWNATSVSENPSRFPRAGRSPCGTARKRFGLVKRQAQLCRGATETMPHVQKAALLAASTCKAVFNHRRWNCSSIDNAPSLSPDLTRGTREQAYVYALSSAAITYSMARACASGHLYHCTCAPNPNNAPLGEFKWGGCGDNVRWGSHFAKQFVDSVERDENIVFEHKPSLKKHNRKQKKNSKTGRERDNKENEKMGDEAANATDDHLEAQKQEKLLRYLSKINLHNNKVGRRIVGQSLTVQCKCHGVSGSCNIKTCWRSLPAMRDVGEKLLQRYTRATEASATYPEVSRRTGVSSATKVSGIDELIFSAKSPDYCTRDARLGSYGTSGRSCNVTSGGTDSCRYLCCGRGYRTVVEEKVERCQCKYYWCCYVRCKTCRTLIQTHECN